MKKSIALSLALCYASSSLAVEWFPTSSIYLGVESDMKHWSTVCRRGSNDDRVNGVARWDVTIVRSDNHKLSLEGEVDHISCLFGEDHHVQNAGGLGVRYMLW